MTGLLAAALLLSLCLIGGVLYLRSRAPKRAEHQHRSAEYQRELDKIQEMVNEGVRKTVVAELVLPDARARQDMEAVYRIISNLELGQKLLSRAADDSVMLQRAARTS